MSNESDLVAAIAGVEEEEVMGLVRQRLEAGVPAAEILGQCNRGMVELGERFGRQECYIPDLMLGGEIMKSVTALLAPQLAAAPAAEAAATAVIGTVHHDHHDIGKDIVVMMLRGIGFEVVDLGVNVPPERFVEAIREHRPEVAGMSVLLTTCYDSVGATVEAVRQAGLRDGVGLMVGGAAASQLLSENAGCDFYGKTAIDGVKYAGRLAGVE